MNRGTILAAELVAVFAAAFVPSGQSVFAATVNADIVQGASSKTNDAFSPNPIQARPGDTVVWTNKDTAIHTVTSGTPSKPEATFGFDSKGSPVLISPQKTFQHTFAQAGDFAYYCQLHPAMVGTVKVAAGGGGGGTAATSIDVKGPDGNTYKVTSSSSTAHATSATIMPADKKVEVKFDGSGDVQLTLQNAMISGISGVTGSGGSKIDFQQVNSTSSDTTIKFILPQGQTSAQITGATVVPEFGPMVALVLALSLVAVIGFARFRGNSLGLGRF
jgi:plastocyanin